MKFSVKAARSSCCTAGWALGACGRRPWSTWAGISVPMRWISGDLASLGKKRETFTVQDFVAMVDQFMEQLGIAQAPLVGH